MHELSITNDVVQLVLEQAADAGATVVKRVDVVVGRMTGVVADCMEFYFEELTKGTAAEGAVINIKVVPTKAVCADCGASFELDDYVWVCTSCGSNKLQIIEGNELLVDTIEVD